MSIPEIEVQRKMAPNFVSADNDREFGWKAYEAGWSLDRLAKDDEKRGWWAALNAQSFAESTSYFAEHGASTEDDYEWIRRGC